MDNTSAKTVIGSLDTSCGYFAQCYYLALRMARLSEKGQQMLGTKHNDFTLSVKSLIDVIFSGGYSSAMDVEFENSSLQRLEADASYDAGYDRAVVRAYRMRLQFIRAALDERAFYAMKSIHFEKLLGDRAGQHSMRLNAQWRLVLKLKRNDSGKTVVVISITDYH